MGKMREKENSEMHWKLRSWDMRSWREEESRKGKKKKKSRETAFPTEHLFNTYCTSESQADRQSVNQSDQFSLLSFQSMTVWSPIGKLTKVKQCLTRSTWVRWRVMNSVRWHIWSNQIVGQCKFNQYYIEQCEQLFLFLLLKVAR